MDIKYRTSHGVHVLELNGNLDTREVPVVVKWFEEHPAARNVLLNMRSVGYVDSSGITVITQGLSRSRANGGDLFLCNLKADVFSTLKANHVDEAVHIYNDEASALKDFPG
ncbi:MAG: hypothetical protein OHK0046_00590 [Anaerolineae bacterium]